MPWEYLVTDPEIAFISLIFHWIRTYTREEKTQNG